MNSLEALYPTAAPSTQVTAPATLAKIDAPAPASKAAKPAPAPPAKVAKPIARLSERAQRLENEGDARLRDVRWGEPAPVSLIDYASLFPGGVPDHEAEGLRAALQLGVGVTQLGAVTRLARSTLREGYVPPTDSEAMEVLRAKWGVETDEKVAKARALCDRVMRTWPGFKHFLEVTRLGSHPTMIRMLAAKASRLEASAEK